MVFAIKMPLDNTYGLPNLFEFKWNHFKNVFKKQNMNLENSNFDSKYTLMSRFHVIFHSPATIGMNYEYLPVFFFNTASTLPPSLTTHGLQIRDCSFPSIVSFHGENSQKNVAWLYCT